MAKCSARILAGSASATLHAIGVARGVWNSHAARLGIRVFATVAGEALPL